MNELVNVQRKSDYRINIENRERVSLTGITGVDSFDESEVNASGGNGGICIYGQKLHITRLDPENGILTVDGFITGVEYTDKDRKEGFLSRIFK